MRERNLLSFVVASAVAVASCAPKPAERPIPSTETTAPRPIRVEVDVHMCVSPPDSGCDPDDPNLGGVSAAIGDENGHVLVADDTDENGRVTLEGDFLPQRLKFLFEEPVSARTPDGSAYLICANRRLYRDTTLPDGSRRVEADILYGGCGPRIPQG